MKPILKITACILLTGVVAFTSCRKSSTSAPPPPDKHLPVANAGPDQTFASPPDNIILDGSTSTDPDGSNSSYQWIRIAGPVTIAIVNGTMPVAKIESVFPGLPVEMGIYEFELKVTNASGLSSKDRVAITVIGPPKANAGTDQTITLPARSTTLDGSASFNLYFPVVAFSWTQISGPTQGRILFPNVVSTAVTDLVEGTYNFRLQITDNLGAVAEDTVQIKVLPNPLSGQEFVFDNLVWESNDFFGLGINDVFAGTPARPNLFDIIRPMEVSIKFDTSSVWISVPYWTSGNSNPSPPLPPNNGYTYEFFNSILFVFAFPLNYQIVGSGVSIKVKFL